MHPDSCSRWLGRGVLGVGCSVAVWLLAPAAASQPLPAAEDDDLRLQQSSASVGVASEAGDSSEAVPVPLHATELVVTHASGNDVDVAQGVRVGAVALLLMQSAIAPGWSLDSGFGLSVGWSMVGLQPWFLLGVYFGSGKDVVIADGSGTARFDHWAVYGLGCPWRFDGPATLALRPCLDFDVGRSSGEGLGAASELESSSPWLSAGVQLRGELELWERLQIGVSAGGFVPLLHSSFSFSAEDTTFQVPPLGFRAGGFASVLF